MSLNYIHLWISESKRAKGIKNPAAVPKMKVNQNELHMRSREQMPRQVTVLLASFLYVCINTPF